MSLITINVDESIYEQVLNALNEFPAEKIQINDDAMLQEEDLELSSEELEDILDEEEDEDDEEDDYFMIVDDNIMPFEVKIIEEPAMDELDLTKTVRIEFENGRRFIGYFTPIEEVKSSLEEEDYYFSGFIIVPEVTEQFIRVATQELIYNEEFFDAFEDEDEYYDDNIDDIDPIRRN